MKPNVITVAEAARRKGCTDQAIYNALNRSDLNEVRMGTTRLVVIDAQFGSYCVKATGGRAHRKKKED